MFINNYIKFEIRPTRPLTLSAALGLSENTTITHLRLNNCGIGADGVDQLSTCLSNKANLQLLALSRNKIVPNGLTNLGKLNYISIIVSRDAM